ncbi:hypothetical protein GCM10027074_54020 [Streptomyces deserti]
MVGASRFVSTVALWMCAATLVGGCTQEAGQNDAGNPRPVPRSSRAQDDLLKSAESVLVRRCLTGRGVTPPPAPPRDSAHGTGSGGGAAQDGTSGRQREFPYGIDDPAWAAEHGFGSAAGTTDRPRTDQARTSPQRQAPQRTPQAQQTPRSAERAAQRRQRLVDALFGTGRRELSTRTATGHLVRAHSDGCLAEAQRVLYGDQARWFRTEVAVNNLQAAAHHRVMRDPAYRAALARWARCIAPVHKAEDPGRLRSAFQDRARGLEPRRAAALQRRFAMAEARCVRSTDLADTGTRLEKRHAADLRAEYADRIADHQRMRERALRHALRHVL